MCLCLSIWFSADLRHLRILGLSYFLYLFLFSGLEYSLTFLTHQRFSYTRYMYQHVHCAFPHSSLHTPASFLPLLEPLFFHWCAGWSKERCSSSLESS